MIAFYVFFFSQETSWHFVAFKYLSLGPSVFYNFQSEIFYRFFNFWFWYCVWINTNTLYKIENYWSVYPAQISIIQKKKNSFKN